MTDVDLTEAMQDVHSKTMDVTIPEFYKGKSIFITGGTGFMGKVLIEKLLWSCPELECIYLLLRAKKGKSGHSRLIDLEKSKLFERLRNRDPDFLLRKLRVVSGDVAEIGLGLSQESRQLLIDNVSVIFHVAASVRFDDSLKEAVFMNARGTREVMLLGQQMKNISVIVHVSTTYCNTDKTIVHEKLYPPHADWRKTIEMAEKVDDNIIRTLTTKYIGNLPNTYVFTKSLAEHAVNDLRGDIPTIIFRPSIVISAREEPLMGWNENFNGPVGLLIACGKGIMRSMCADPSVKADYIPVDIAIKALIIAAWKHGVEHKVEKEIPVYNCSSALISASTYKEIVEMGIQIMQELPLNDVLWIPGGGFTTFKTVHYFRFLFYHLLPAFFLDMILKLSGRKPMLFRLQRKIYIASEALRYYITNQFLFKNDNFLKLREFLSESDVSSFTYRFDDIVPYQFLKDCTLGGRRYLLHESDETIPKAKAHYRRMVIVDRVTKIIFWTIFAVWLYRSTFVRSVFDVLLPI